MFRIPIRYCMKCFRWQGYLIRRVWKDMPYTNSCQVFCIWSCGLKYLTGNLRGVLSVKMYFPGFSWLRISTGVSTNLKMLQKDVFFWQGLCPKRALFFMYLTIPKLTLGHWWRDNSTDPVVIGLWVQKPNWAPSEVWTTNILIWL